MSTTSASGTPTLIAKIGGWILGVAGVVMIVIGGCVWGYTSSQLSAQHIDVAAVTADNPGPHSGEPVKGPITAMAQAHAIGVHVNEATDNRTYAQIPSTTTVTVDGKQMVAGKDGKSTGVEATSKQLADNSARTTAMNGAFLQASLYTSVIAFGVSALIMGLGLLFAITGAIFIILLWKKGKTTEATAAHKHKEAATA